MSAIQIRNAEEHYAQSENVLDTTNSFAISLKDLKISDKLAGNAPLKRPHEDTVEIQNFFSDQTKTIRLHDTSNSCFFPPSIVPTQRPF